MNLLTRDSVVWWLAILAAVATYLGSAPPPTEWTYPQWVQTVSFIIATLSGKFATSPLPHSTEGDAQVTPSGK